MKKINMNTVQEAGGFSRPEAGAYVCVIRKVEDNESKEYLRIFYDIAEGEFKGYYDNLRADHPDWENAGSYVRSYKARALPFFKRFCSAVSKSNGSFVFDGGNINADERTLTGKKVGIVFQEEEYYGNDGEKKTRLIVYKEFPADQIDKQKIPNMKKVADDQEYQVAGKGDDSFMNLPDSDEDEIPFS